MPKGKKRPHYTGKCRLPCSVYRCLSGSGNCLTLLCLLLLFEQFVAVRIRFFVYDSCHSFVFSVDFLFARSSCVVFLLFNARALLVYAWAFLSYPVGWHDVALILLLISLQCSLSISNCCDNSVRISVKCKIGTDTGCAGRRRQRQCITKNTVLKQLVLKQLYFEWMADSI